VEPGERKASVEEIRARFDKDVERFSNVETGQSATVDAPLTLELLAEAAAGLTPDCTALLDIGCGAGNFTLKLMDFLPRLGRVTLVDLSQPMLDRARQRIQARRDCAITGLQADIRDASLPEGEFDVVIAAAVLHHLRGDSEWQSVFSRIHRSLRAGGCFLVSDLVAHSMPAVQSVMWRRYGEYLTALKGPEYRNHVFDYVAYEDTPRPVVFQLDLMREVGFRNVDILHKNSCFAAFVGIK
jgi:tRNA (cmo5U34)-methyltransferase